MQVVKSYEQVGVWDPTDPSIRMREVYTGGPSGGYSSYYWKTTPGGADLKGLAARSRQSIFSFGARNPQLKGLGFWSSVPPLGQAAVVGLLAVAAGYLGMKHLGPTVKSKLGLQGARRRRRR